MLESKHRPLRARPPSALFVGGLLLGFGCGAPPSVDTHTQALQVGEITVLQGTSELVSGGPETWGLRSEPSRNDLARVASAYRSATADFDGLLVLWTTFSDTGGGGPAYYIPIYNPTEGIGLGPVDRRATYETERLRGLVNMKRRQDHPPGRLAATLAQELGHAFAAYLDPVLVGTSTETIDVLSTDRSHWAAWLHTDGSVLGGHRYVSVEPNRFRVTARNVGFSSLDLYTMGLLGPEEVEDTFIISNARTLTGAVLPRDAILGADTEILGTAVPISIDAVVRTMGPRNPPFEPPQMTARFVLLTAPNETTTSTSVQSQAQALDVFRAAFEALWPSLTRNRGILCTRAQCRSPTDAGIRDEDSGAKPETDAGQSDAGEPEETPPTGCSCETKSPQAPLKNNIIVSTLLLGACSRLRRKSVD